VHFKLLTRPSARNIIQTDESAIAGEHRRETHLGLNRLDGAPWFVPGKDIERGGTRQTALRAQKQVQPAPAGAVDYCKAWFRASRIRRPD
jgi:hypothetical protein